MYFIFSSIRCLCFPVQLQRHKHHWTCSRHVPRNTQRRLRFLTSNRKEMWVGSCHIWIIKHICVNGDTLSVQAHLTSWTWPKCCMMKRWRPGSLKKTCKQRLSSWMRSRFSKRKRTPLIELCVSHCLEASLNFWSNCQIPPSELMGFAQVSCINFMVFECVVNWSWNALMSMFFGRWPELYAAYASIVSPVKAFHCFIFWKTNRWI